MSWGSNLAEALKSKFSPNYEYEDEDYLDDEDTYEEEVPKKKSKSGVKISPFSRKTSNAPSYDYEIVAIKPVSIDDMNQVVDNLKDGNVVMLNTESCDEQLARRALDFVTGAVYALCGNFAQISLRRSNSAIGIYTITPSNVNISGKVEEEMD